MPITDADFLSYIKSGKRIGVDCWRKDDLTWQIWHDGGAEIAHALGITKPCQKCGTPQSWRDHDAECPRCRAKDKEQP